LNLTLVAHRVNNWVRSITFRIAILGGIRPYKMFSNALYSLPPSFFSTSVTSLLILNSTPSSDAHRALELCTNAESLAYWNFTFCSPQTLIAALPLRRLAIPVGLFSRLCEVNATRFVHTLRELALIVTFPDEDIEEPKFGAFPSLTHFGINTVSIGSLVPKLVKAMLAVEQCQVLVLQGEYSTVIDDFAVDRRFVFYQNEIGFFREWKELEEDSRNGFWARAETEIAAR